MKNKDTLRLESEIYEATAKRGVYGCFEVTIGILGDERVDYITYDTNGVFRCYEIKTSVSDFHSQCATSFVGHFNYYVLTKSVYDKVKDEIPSDIGVYVEDRMVKKAKRRVCSVSENVLKDSLIRSLSREADKVFRGSCNNSYMRTKSALTECESEKKGLRRAYNDLLLFIYKKFGFDWQEEFCEWSYATTRAEKEKGVSNMQKEILHTKQNLRLLPKNSVQSRKISNCFWLFK